MKKLLSLMLAVLLSVSVCLPARAADAAADANVIIHAPAEICTSLRIDNRATSEEQWGDMAVRLPEGTIVGPLFTAAEGWRIADVRVDLIADGQPETFDARGSYIHGQRGSYLLEHHIEITVTAEPIPDNLPTVASVRLQPEEWTDYETGETWLTYWAQVSFAGGTEQQHAAQLFWEYLEPTTGQWNTFASGTQNWEFGEHMLQESQQCYGVSLYGKQIRARAEGFANYSVGGPVYSEPVQMPDGECEDSGGDDWEDDREYLDFSQIPSVPAGEDTHCFTLNAPDTVTTTLELDLQCFRDTGSVSFNVPNGSYVGMEPFQVAEGYRIVDVTNEYWYDGVHMVENEREMNIGLYDWSVGYPMEGDRTITVTAEPVPDVLPAVSGVQIEPMQWKDYRGEVHTGYSAGALFTGGTEQPYAALFSVEYYDETWDLWLEYTRANNIDLYYLYDAEEMFGVSLYGKQVRFKATGLPNYSVGGPVYSTPIQLPDAPAEPVIPAYCNFEIDMPDQITADLIFREGEWEEHLQQIRGMLGTGLSSSGQAEVRLTAEEGWRVADVLVDRSQSGWGPAVSEREAYIHDGGAVYQMYSDCRIRVLAEPIPDTLPTLTGATLLAEEQPSESNGCRYPCYRAAAQFTGGTEEWYAAAPTWEYYDAATGSWCALAHRGSRFDCWLLGQDEALFGVSLDGCLLRVRLDPLDRYSVGKTVYSQPVQLPDLTGAPSVGVTVQYGVSGAGITTNEGELQVTAAPLTTLSAEAAAQLAETVAIKNAQGYTAVAQMELVLRSNAGTLVARQGSLEGEVMVDLKPFFGDTLDLTRTDVTYVLLHYSTEYYSESCPADLHEHAVEADGLVQMSGLSPVWLLAKAADAYTPGDINGDGQVNNKDATRLFQYLSNWEVETVAAALDVNGDGQVNNKDATRLFQYLSDWDVPIF